MRNRRSGYARINNRLADGLVGLQGVLPDLVAGAEALKTIAYDPVKGNPRDGEWEKLDRLMDTIRGVCKAEKELALTLGFKREGLPDETNKR